MSGVAKPFRPKVIQRTVCGTSWLRLVLVSVRKMASNVRGTLQTPGNRPTVALPLAGRPARARRPNSKEIVRISDISVAVRTTFITFEPQAFDWFQKSSVLSIKWPRLIPRLSSALSATASTLDFSRVGAEDGAHVGEAVARTVVGLGHRTVRGTTLAEVSVPVSGLVSTGHGHSSNSPRFQSPLCRSCRPLGLLKLLNRPCLTWAP